MLTRGRFGRFDMARTVAGPAGVRTDDVYRGTLRRAAAVLTVAARLLRRMLPRCAALLPVVMIGGCSVLDAIASCTPVKSKHGPGDYIGSLYYKREIFTVSGRQIESYTNYNMNDVTVELREKWLGKTFPTNEEMQRFAAQHFLNCLPGNSPALDPLKINDVMSYVRGDIVCLYGGKRNQIQFLYSKCLYKSYVTWIDLTIVPGGARKIDGIHTFLFHDERLADTVEKLK